MFKVYKYKSISVFLLTFFMLTNGFSSFKKEEEYSDEEYSSSSQENSSQENIDEMPSLPEINQSHRRTLESFGFFNLHNEIIKSCDDLPSEQNNSHKKRKISIEETNKVQEEKIEEEKNKKTENRKNSTRWTPAMITHLGELKTKELKPGEIAQKMNEKFPEKEFTKSSVKLKWGRIVKNKNKK